MNYFSRIAYEIDYRRLFAISSAISLKEWYKLAKGESYIVRYYAFNPTMKQAQSQLMEMQSNKVEIAYY